MKIDCEMSREKDRVRGRRGEREAKKERRKERARGKKASNRREFATAQSGIQPSPAQNKRDNSQIPCASCHSSAHRDFDSSLFYTRPSLFISCRSLLRALARLYPPPQRVYAPLRRSPSTDTFAVSVVYRQRVAN